MIKYQYTESGIMDRETGANIPLDPGNRDYRGFLEWEADSANVAIPMQPSMHHNLDETDPTNPIWVEDVTAREDAEARQLLADTDKEQARTVDDIIEHLVNGTPLPQIVLNRQAARASAREKL